MIPTLNKVPRHVAIIMDGNRRFAKQLMLKPWKGHEWGAKKLESVLKWCNEFDIKELTVYAFSVENFGRPKEEFDYIMNVFRKEIKNLKDRFDEVKKDGMKINFIGRLWMFPEDIQKLTNEVMEMTKSFNKFTLNLAFGYGGQQEVVDAAKKIAQQVKEGKLDIKDINEELFAEHCYGESEPDLIIRTGGEIRTSNFLLYQSAYSELYFIDELWPEFEKKDFVKALTVYSDRDRRLGR